MHHEDEGQDSNGRQVEPAGARVSVQDLKGMFQVEVDPASPMASKTSKGPRQKGAQNKKQSSWGNTGIVFELDGDNDAGQETVVDDAEYIDVETSGVLSTALALHDCGANSTGAAGRNRKTALGTKGTSVAAAFPVAVVKLASACVPPSV